MLRRVLPRIPRIPRFRNGTHVGFSLTRTKRSPKAARRPKPEYAAVLGDQQRTAPRPIRISDFGLPSDFGFRISDFESNYSRRLAKPSYHTPAVFVTLFTLATLCGCGPSPSEGPPPAAAPVTVQTVLPKHGEIARTITLPSFRILAYQEATLYAKVSGYLKTLTVDKGDGVKEGRLLAEIEVPELLADEVQYKVESAVSRTNYERMAEARRRAPDLVIPQTVDDLRGQWEVAQAKLQRTQTLLQYARIVAPFSGVITARFVDPGAFIPAATAGSTPQSAAMVTLMDYTRVRVQVFVPEAEVPFIKNGLPVQVTVEELPGRSFPATVTRFAHALNEATKTMLTEIEMANPNGDLRPGAYASVRLEVERKPDALLVPVQALLVEKAGTFLFTVADNKAKKTPIHVGFNDGVNVEVTDAKPDQRVILVGKQTLTDGQPVNAMEAK
jgi:RND family efflux transporter MFP subunit